MLTSDTLKRGNVKMTLTDDEKKTVELSKNDNGELKTASEIDPVTAITSTCVES